MKANQISKWQLKSATPIFESEYIGLYDHTYLLPNGETKGGYYHVTRPNYVLILALSDHNRLLVEQQYRRGVDEILYEIPAGWVDKGEDPVQTAIREFKEETGFNGEGKLLAELSPQPGFMSMKAFVVLLKFKEIERQAAQLADDEEITTSFKTIAEVQAMVRAGEITDMNFLAAFALLLAQLNLSE